MKNNTQPRKYANYRYNTHTGELRRYRNPSDRMIETWALQRKLNEHPTLEDFSENGDGAYVRFSNGIAYIVTRLSRGKVKARCNELFGVQA